MSETARYQDNVIPFPARPKSLLQSGGHAASAQREHEAAMRIAHVARKNGWSDRPAKWLSVLVRVLISRRKTADYHSLDDHILKDMGLSRHHVTWLDPNRFG